MKFTDRLRRHLPCFVIPIAPKFPPKNVTFWDIILIVILTAMGYVGSIVVTRGEGISFADFLSRDLADLSVAAISLVISILLVEIRSAKRSVSGALWYTFSQANKEISEQRKKALQTILMYSPSPCRVLRKYLGSDLYEDFNTDTIEREMKDTHNMYTINSYDVIPKQQLDEESVQKYLNTQKQLVQNGYLAVERLFRVKTNGIRDMLKSEGKESVKEFTSTIEKHRMFKAKIHLYTDKNPVNTFLDYAIAYQKARTVVFITDTDELLRHKRYTGIKTSDPAIIEILLKDRFEPNSTAVEKRYTSKEFVQKAKLLFGQ